jgi:predicted nucleic acid-binding protein
MANVLVDTSAWVDFFRGTNSPAAASLDRLLEERQVVLCGTVELELLQGAKPGEKAMLEDLLTALPYVETEREDFQKAGELLNGLRVKGFQIPASDGLIAALCSRHELSLLTLDKHFNHFHHIKKIKV